MQRPRNRKSGTASGTEGITQAQKQNGVSSLNADSWSYADGLIRNNTFVSQSQFGQSSLEPASSLPVRKLCPEDLSKEFEPKRRSPGVIARLMGLEALPSTRHIQTHQERFIENHQYDSRSTRMSSSEHLKFKDVYEDLEAAHIANRCCSSKGHTISILVEPETARVGDNLKEAKLVFEDENFPYSKELNDSSSLLDYNNDLFYQRRPPGNYIAILKPEKYRGKTKPSRSAGETSSSRHNVMSRTKRQDGLLLEPYNQLRLHVSQKSTSASLKDTDEGDILSLPTRIVVLKPNLGEIQNVSTSKSVPVGSHLRPRRIRKMKEYKSVGDSENVSRSKEETYDKVGSSMITSKAAREIAREIARKMRNGSDATKGIRSIRCIGYAGDESSYDPYETDSESESEVITLSSMKSFDDSNSYRYPSSTLTGSFANKEAQKRLPERLKTTQEYQDPEIFTKRTTLGEMLSLPDGGARPNLVHAKGLAQTSNRLCGIKQNAVRDDHLGISSRDGWPSEAIKLSSSLRSRPHPIGRSCSNKRRSDWYEFREERDLMHVNSSLYSKSKMARGKSSHQEKFASEISRSRGKKPLSCSRHTLIDETGSSSDASFKTQMTANAKVILEDPRTCQTDSKSDTCENHVPDGEDSAVLVQEDSACEGKPNLASPSSHHLEAEPKTTQSSNSKDDVDHHSPVSILEVPYVEDAPTFESFERVSAELHELRMQLRLLKMESGTYTVSSNLDEEVATPNTSERSHTQEFTSENWETPCVLDLLINNGLEESDLRLFRTWYSLDCPLDPKLFDELKKSYGDKMESSRSERRLLSDGINSHISEIFLNHVNLYPWVTPRLSGSCLKLQNEAIRDAFKKLIDQNFSNRERSDVALDREVHWPDMKGEINAIGNEIASLLVDDTITDVICKTK